MCSRTRRRDGDNGFAASKARPLAIEVAHNEDVTGIRSEFEDHGGGCAVGGAEDGAARDEWVAREAQGFLVGVN